jgi:ketol-acid reductoisomerase
LAGPIRAAARPGALLVFAHGFALAHGGVDRVRSDLDVAVVGPLGPGALLRRRFLEGTGLAGLLAMVRDVTGTGAARALAYAAALRMTRAGVLATTLDEEVVSDLFAEQTVLTGGVVELMRAAWETLVEDGISPEIAYYSCVQELKQILDVIHAEGVAGMRARISGTARFGGITRGPRVVGPETRLELRRILAEIRSGAFAREWADERRRGGLESRQRDDAEHPSEEAGRWVRRQLGEVDTSRGEP